MRFLSMVAGGLVLLLDGSFLVAQPSSPASPALLKATFGKLPLYFVENRGVYSDEVAYYIQGADKTLFFAPDGITFRLTNGDQAWAVKLDFVGANPDVAPRGEDRQAAVFSYFRGPRDDWKAGLPTFSKVLYPDLWPGIDLVYSGTVNQLKYEFVVPPGADPAQIRLRYRGAQSVAVTESGALRVTTPGGSFEDAPPVAWQEIGGQRVPVKMAYRLDPEAAGDGFEFGFDLGAYDPAHLLVLDPAVLVYCGYIGGSGNDYPWGIAVDSAGNTYVAGNTNSNEQSFPVTVGPDLTYNGAQDVFVVKVNPQGTALLYCGYLGGSGSDACYGIAVDAAGNAYVTGETYSTEQTFPVTVGPNLTYSGPTDAFVAKVNPQGTGLVYCGYLGGSGSEYGGGIAVDAAANAYVAGRTNSTEQTFPVTVGPDLTYNGGCDAFVAKVNPQGTGLVYCGYLGGSSEESGWRIAVDAASNAYLTGYTRSTEQTFPVTVGPSLTYNGDHDVFVAKVNPQGTGLVYCGYIGGSGADFGEGIAVDAAGNTYVTGLTTSAEQTFPVTVGPDLTHNGGPNLYDAFVAKVNASGTALVYCGYVGGSGDDRCFGIAVDASSNAYLTGYTSSTEQTFPVTIGPDLTHNGSNDAFVAKVDPQGTALVYCGYIGGSAYDLGRDIAVDAAGNAYVTGQTQSTEQTFPVTVGPDLTNNGGVDAFVAKITGTCALAGSGSFSPGGQVNLSLLSSGDAGLAYQLGSALASGPIAIVIDTRKLELSPDWLLFVSVWGTAPGIFQNYVGVLNAQGQAKAVIIIPNIPSLKGIRIYTAFVTLKPTAPSGVAGISNTFLFSIQ